MTFDLQHALLDDNEVHPEPTFIYTHSFEDIMTADFADVMLTEPASFSFRGTVALKRALNALRFDYKRGYHSGLSRCFRYGFSILQHEQHRRVKFIDQERYRMGIGTTPHEREAAISIWNGSIASLCPDIAKGCFMLNITLPQPVGDAIHVSSEVLGLRSQDIGIVVLYTALLRSNTLDAIARTEGERFVTAFENHINIRTASITAISGTTITKPKDGPAEPV